MLFIFIILSCVFLNTLSLGAEPSNRGPTSLTTLSSLSSCNWLNLAGTEAKKPDYDDGQDDTPPGGNEFTLPMPVVDPDLQPLEPDDVFGPPERAVLEITNEHSEIYSQVSRYLTEVYPKWINARRVVNQRKALDDEEVKFTYLIVPGSYQVDLMSPSSKGSGGSGSSGPGGPCGSGIGSAPRGPSGSRGSGAWNQSRPDLNPFFFGSMRDLKLTVEVWQTERPVGLQTRMAVYRRLVLRGRKESLEALMRMSYEYFQEGVADTDTIAVYSSTHWGGWTMPQKVPKRPLDTVYLDGNLRFEILNDLQRFYGSEALYKKYAIPYRHSYLLAGPPGTGKTSLIRALASEMNKSIGLLQFSRWFGLSELQQALSSIPADFLVIEDVDSLYAGRGSDPNRNGLTFSDFINVVDGIASREGVVLFMTSNHPDRLDPALIRPGRVDFLVHMGHITETQVREMFLAYFPEQEANFEPFYADLTKATEGSMSAAELQNFFFRHLDCSDIRDYLEELLQGLQGRKMEEAEQIDPCKAYIGLELEKALGTAVNAGYKVRVTRIDDKYFPVTMDLCSDRINFGVEEGEVTECKMG